MDTLRGLPCLLAVALCASAPASAQESERLLRSRVRTAMVDSALVRVTVGPWRAPIGRVTSVPGDDVFVLDPDGPEGPAWIPISEVRLLEQAISERAEARASAKGWLIGALAGGGAATFACRRRFSAPRAARSSARSRASSPAASWAGPSRTRGIPGRRAFVSRSSGGGIDR